MRVSHCNAAALAMAQPSASCWQQLPHLMQPSAQAAATAQHGSPTADLMAGLSSSGVNTRFPGRPKDLAIITKSG